MDRLRLAVHGMGVAGVVLALYLTFFWVPMEATMGYAQRIFYGHVAAAVSAFVCYGGVFLGSWCFLRGGSRAGDVMAWACAEMGLVWSGVVLISGPIWGRAVWGVYWRWEPRLTTMVILTCVYLGYWVVRSHGGDSGQDRRLGAVLGIAAFVNVPLVYWSVELWAPEQQLHPRQVGMDPRMGWTLAVHVAAFLLLTVGLVWEGALLRLSEEKLAELTRRGEEAA